MTRTNEEMPTRANNWSDVPSDVAQLYETKTDNNHIWYELSPAGHALKRARRAVADNPHKPALPGQVISTTRQDWMTAVGLAKAAERAVLIRMAGADRVRLFKSKA